MREKINFILLGSGGSGEPTKNSYASGSDCDDDDEDCNPGSGVKDDTSKYS